MTMIPKYKEYAENTLRYEDFMNYSQRLQKISSEFVRDKRLEFFYRLLPGRGFEFIVTYDHTDIYKGDIWEAAVTAYERA